MATPVITLNNSPAKWDGVPVPADAMLILPGLALAEAINSGTVFAGTDGCTSMTRGVRMMHAIGAMSRRKTKLSLSKGVALIACDASNTRSVYPSAGARTTTSVPILVAAPGGFSIKKGGPSRSDSHGPIRRARMSLEPAGGNGTIMRTGRDG